MIPLATIIVLVIASFLALVVGPFAIGYTNGTPSAPIALIVEAIFALFAVVAIAVTIYQGLQVNLGAGWMFWYICVGFVVVMIAGAGGLEIGTAD